MRVSKLAMRIILLAAFVITLISFTVVPTIAQEGDFLTPEEQQWLSEHEGKIRYAPNPNYPPIAFVDEDGTFKGITADYIEIIEQKLDFRFERVYCDTWNEMVESARQGKIDLIGAIQNTPERREFLRFTTPFVTIPNSIVVREDLKGTLTPDIMAGMKVVIVEGYSSYDYVENAYPDIMLEPVRDNPSGLQMVSFGRADAMITDLAVASYFIEKLGITNLRVAGSIDYTWELCFGSKKDWPVLQSILQKVLDDISPEEKAAIYRKWVNIPRADTWKEVIVPLLIGLGVVVVIVGGVLITIWNRSLNRQVKGRTADLAKELAERKQAEETLRESEASKRAIINATPDSLAVVDERGIILDINETMAERFGKRKEELIGIYGWDLLPPDLAKSRRGHFEEVFKTGQIVHFEDDSAGVYFDNIVYPIFRKGGKVTKVAVIARDITERKHMEEELKESEEKFRSLFKTMLNGFAYCKILVDKDNQPIDFVHLEVNSAWERLVGLKSEDAIGKKITEVIPGIKESETNLISIYGQVALTGESTKFELHFEPLGKWFYISVYSPAKGYFVTVFEDITERKEAEGREKELQQELNLSSRLASVGELAAGVAHELNNPLTGILGFSERLLRKSTEKEISRGLEKIHSEALRAARVVQNLRTFARRREPSKEYSNVNNIVRRALELRAYELKTGNIEVVTDLTPRLPKAMVDFYQIQEVFLNIILNAEQAMTEANGGGKFSIKTGEVKDCIRASFTDDGPGIPADQLGKVFDPFFTTRGEKGGTGLGLSVCHGIVTEHGGKIYAKSKAGKGATFFVELPLPTKG